MNITKRSQLTGEAHTLDLPVTLEELERHRRGELAQNVWPHLTKEQREFLISGITAAEWAAEFGQECADERGADDWEQGENGDGRSEGPY